MKEEFYKMPKKFRGKGFPLHSSFIRKPPRLEGKVQNKGMRSKKK